MQKYLGLAMVVLGVIGVRPAAAAEYDWLILEAAFNYRDFNFACSTEPGNRLYLRLEKEGGRVTGAVLKEGELAPLPSAYNIVFTPEEVSALTFQRDDRGRTWLLSFPITGRLTNWLFNHGGGTCLAREFASLTSSHAALSFQVPATHNIPGLFHSDSNLISLSGTTTRAGNFSADLKVVQKQVEPQWPALD